LLHTDDRRQSSQSTFLLVRGWAGYNVESHFRVTSQSPRMIDIDVKSLLRWSRRGGAIELAANFQLLRDRVLCPPRLRRSHEWRARHRLIRSARSRSPEAARRCRRQDGTGVGRQGGRKPRSPRCTGGNQPLSTAPPIVHQNAQKLAPPSSRGAPGTFAHTDQPQPRRRARRSTSWSTSSTILLPRVEKKARSNTCTLIREKAVDCCAKGNELFLLSFRQVGGPWAQVSCAKAPVHKNFRINGQIPDAVIPRLASPACTRLVLEHHLQDPFAWCLPAWWV
jgi:hypothetical protein